MKRSEFKKLLKECLLEILTEEPMIKQSLQEVAFNNAPRATNNVHARQLARQVTGADEFEQQNEVMLMEKISSMSHGISGGDRKQAELMKSIFADTALNTLPQQHEFAPGMTANGMDAPGVDISDLAQGGDMSHWANLAFSGKK